MAPPPIAGMRVSDFLARMRSLLPPQVSRTAELDATLLSLMRVDGGGRIRPRLSRANHLRILHAIWQQDGRELLARVRVPTLVIASHGADSDPSFAAAKREAAARVRAIGPPIRFEWMEGIYDLPLHLPEGLARRISRFVQQARV